MKRFAPRHLRSGAVALLSAPTVSLVTARLSAQAVGALHLCGLFPSGVHTYFPLAAILPLPAINAGAAMLLVAALGLGLVTIRRDGARLKWRGVIQFVFVLALAQLVLYAVQLGALSAISGIFDSSTTLLAAPLVEAVIFGLALGLGLSVALALNPFPTRRLSLRVGGTVRTGTLRAEAPHTTGMRTHPLRGPPQVSIA